MGGGRNRDRRAGTLHRRLRNITRVNVSSFTGISLHIYRIGAYRPIGGDGGLLRFAVFSNMGSEAIIDNVTGCCGPRRLVNGGVVLIRGLGPTGLYNIRDYNVVLSTIRNSSLGIIFISGVPINSGVYWFVFIRAI